MEISKEVVLVAQTGEVRQVCEICPSGFVSETTQATECHRCPDFLTQPRSDRSGCAACPSGTFVNYKKLDDPDFDWSCEACPDAGEDIEAPAFDWKNCTYEPTLMVHPDSRYHSSPETYEIKKISCQCKGLRYRPSPGAKCKAFNEGGVPRGGVCTPIQKQKFFKMSSSNGKQILDGKTRRLQGDTGNDTDITFLECRSDESCPGVVLDSDADLGSETILQSVLNDFEAQSQEQGVGCFGCAQGYTGPLCFQCDRGYTRAGVSVCAKCIPKAVVFGLLLFGGIVATTVTVYIIKRTIAHESKESDEIIVLKILTSHMQAEGMVQNLDLTWPSWLTTVFNYMDLVSSAGQSIFSLDCIVDSQSTDESCNSETTLDVEDIASDKERVRAFFLTALFMASLPVIGLVLSAIFWTAYYKREKKAGRPKGKSAFNYFLISNVIIVFLLYPTLARTTLKFFTCSRETLAGFKLLEADFNIICWSDEHWAWAMTLGLLMVSLYLVGIPAISFLILKKNVAGNTKYKDVFAFMFQGFREKRYYWEIVIMIRKLGLAFCAIVLKPLGTDIQAYGACMVVLCAMYWQTEIKPYESPKMNFAEMFGLSTLFYTLFMGLCQSSPSLALLEDSTVPTVVGISIIALNCFFLFYVIYQLLRVGRSSTTQVMSRISKRETEVQVGGMSSATK